MYFNFLTMIDPLMNVCGKWNSVSVCDWLLYLLNIKRKQENIHTFAKWDLQNPIDGENFLTKLAYKVIET